MPELNGVEEALRQTIQDLEARIQVLQEQVQKGETGDTLEALRTEVVEKFREALEALGIAVAGNAGEDTEEARETEAAEPETDETDETGSGEGEKKESGEDQFEEERQQLLGRIAELEAELHEFRASVVADLRVCLGYVAEEARDGEFAKLVERTKESLSDAYSDLMADVTSRLGGERRWPGKIENPALSGSGKKELAGFRDQKEFDDGKGGSEDSAPLDDQAVVKRLVKGDLPW